MVARRVRHAAALFLASACLVVACAGRLNGGSEERLRASEAELLIAATVKALPIALICPPGMCAVLLVDSTVRAIPDSIDFNLGMMPEHASLDLAKLQLPLADGQRILNGAYRTSVGNDTAMLAFAILTPRRAREAVVFGSVQAVQTGLYMFNTRVRWRGGQWVAEPAALRKFMP